MTRPGLDPAAEIPMTAKTTQPGTGPWAAGRPAAGEPALVRPYVPLWCKSNYSFLEGASHPEELIEACLRKGIPALALTDRNGVYGIVRAHVRARRLGVHLIVGSQVSLRDGSEIVLLVRNREGYRNLCRLLTDGHLRSAKGEFKLEWREVCRSSAGLIALWGGRSHARSEAETGPEPVLERLQAAFEDRLYVLIARHRRAEEVLPEVRLRKLAHRFKLPTVAAVEVLYHSPQRRRLQDVLTCIREGVTLSTAGRIIPPNDQHALKSRRELASLFADDPESVERTRQVAARCSFSLRELRYRYPLERLPQGETTGQYLRERTFEGAARRLGEKFRRQIPQLEKELELIRELEYEGYFLTMYEIVEYCRRHGILCQGRGSAANSVVCFALGITSVDPTQVNLLFERFLSRERAEPPDIDLDIEHNRREEVIQHVYQKYGRERAAMVANVVRYRYRSAVREVGKALGIAATSLDRLAKLVSHDGWSGELIGQAGLDSHSPSLRHLVSLVEEIQDFPRHLSIHPGGFLLGHRPVHELVPIENASMENRTVIQWDKEDVEQAGLFKVDLLGLGALTHLHLCFDLLRRHRRQTLSLGTLPREDTATFDMVCRSDTVGVFQIESRAQMAMLGRLKPRSYYDLVIEISIVRPGPITGGMVHPYLRRRNREEAVDYPHPCLVPVLEKTLGIPLFQEQVMQLAMVAADYTPGEADQLRRDMAAWRRSGRIERHHRTLVTRMVKKGIRQEFAERIFQQIRGFGDYGFPESHAASFAHIAYATAYLKCHYPAEFVCALLNAQPMGFYSVATIVNDARIQGLEVRPVSMLDSRWDCTLVKMESGGREPAAFAVRMGLRFVRGLGEEDWQKLAGAARQAPFSDLADVVRRSGLRQDKLEALAEAGAFECFGLDRRGALWQIHGSATGAMTGVGRGGGLVNKGRRAPRPISGFETPQQAVLPLSSRDPLPLFPPLTGLETIVWDHRTGSHSPRGHLLKPLRPALTAQGLPTARQLNRMPDGCRVRYAGMVICRQRPGNARGVTFMTLEDETGFVNLVIWKRTFRRYSLPAKTLSCMGVTGKLQVAEGVTHLVVERIWKPRLEKVSFRPPSRDFH